MATLINRLRSVISSQIDDFFEDDILLFYLNRSQQRIVSTLASLEQTTGKSLRSLDNLRTSTNITVTAPVLIKDKIYQGFSTLPSNVLQIQNILLDGNVPVREISTTKLNLVFEGNMIPTEIEHFYYILTENNTLKINFFQNNNLTKNYKTIFISKPSNLILTSTVSSSIPIHLENALLYGSAEMALMQETGGTASEAHAATINMYGQMYQRELQSGVF